MLDSTHYFLGRTRLTCIVTQTLTLTLTRWPTYLLAYDVNPNSNPNQVTRQKLSFIGARAVLMISDDNPGADRLAEVSGKSRGERGGMVRNRNPGRQAQTWRTQTTQPKP